MLCAIALCLISCGSSGKFVSPNPKFHFRHPDLHHHRQRCRAALLCFLHACAELIKADLAGAVGINLLEHVASSYSALRFWAESTQDLVQLAHEDSATAVLVKDGERLLVRSDNLVRNRWRGATGASAITSGADGAAAGAGAITSGALSSGALSSGAITSAVGSATASAGGTFLGTTVAMCSFVLCWGMLRSILVSGDVYSREGKVDDQWQVVRRARDRRQQMRIRLCDRRIRHWPPGML